MEITLIKEELKYYFKNWKETPENKQWDWRKKITKAQQELWPTSSCIRQDQFSNSDTEKHIALRLLKADGFDGNTVGSRSVSMSKKYFEDNENLHWPPLEDIIRLGHFLHIGFYKTLGLIVKMMWERYFKTKIWGNINYNKYDRLSDCLKKNTEAAQHFNESFFNAWFDHETIKSIWYIFEENKKMATQAGYNDYKKFKSLIIEIIQSQLQMYATSGNNWKNYIAEKENEVINSSTEYWKVKINKTELETEIGDLFLKYETLKKQNYKTKMQWLQQFGKAFIACQQLKIQRDILRNGLNLRETNKELSDEELYGLAKEKTNDSQKKLEELHGEHEKARNLKKSTMQSIPLEKYNAYKKEIKKTLREIWRLTHTDVTDLENFSDEERQLLSGYFAKAMEIYEHTGFDDDSDEISLFKLRDMLNTIQLMWETIGLEIPKEGVIPGNTLAEKVGFLKNKVEILKNEKLELQAMIKAETENQDIIEKTECLSTQENQKMTTAMFSNLKKDLEKEIEHLKQECYKAGWSPEHLRD